MTFVAIIRSGAIVAHRGAHVFETKFFVTAIGVALGNVEGLVGGDHVARIDISGIIVDDPWRDDVLSGVAADKRAKALIVRIDSPGGTVVGGEALFHSLRAVAEKMPVIAVMGEMATSAGYMTALAADHIVARSGTLTGSIGVLMQTADVTDLLEKIGVKPETIKSGPLKAQPNPLESFSAEGREAAQSVVKDMYDMFVAMVGERRGMSREEVLTLADGRVFTGRQALATELIDGLGGEDEARLWLEKTHGIATTMAVADLTIEREDGVWRKFIEGTLGKALFSERLRLDGLLSLWHPGLM